MGGCGVLLLCWGPTTTLLLLLLLAFEGGYYWRLREVRVERRRGGIWAGERQRARDERECQERATTTTTRALPAPAAACGRVGCVSARGCGGACVRACVCVEGVGQEEERPSPPLLSSSSPRQVPLA